MWNDRPRRGPARPARLRRRSASPGSRPPERCRAAHTYAGCADPACAAVFHLVFFGRQVPAIWSAHFWTPHSWTWTASLFSKWGQALDAAAFDRYIANHRAKENDDEPFSFTCNRNDGDIRADRGGATNYQTWRWRANRPRPSKAANRKT